MATRVIEETELIQYADDIFILFFGSSFHQCKANLEQNAYKLVQQFHEHQFTVNTSKFEFSKRKDFI